jgi:glutathione gamma-glutamylcysteinyltransferase
LLSDPATLRTAYAEESIHLVTQADEGSCFRASATTVLNALSAHGVAAPTDPVYKPYAYWTQATVIAPGCRGNCSDEYCRGASLDEAASALACSGGVDAHSLHAGDPGLANPMELASLLRATVGSPGAHLIANFIGKPMGMQHYGHYSPLAAYHPTARGGGMVLVLDVSRYKFPPWWVPLETLWRGIDTLDGEKRRGVVQVHARSATSAAASEIPAAAARVVAAARGR